MENLRQGERLESFSIGSGTVFPASCCTVTTDDDDQTVAVLQLLYMGPAQVSEPVGNAEERVGERPQDGDHH